MADDNFSRFVILLSKKKDIESTEEQIKSHISYLRALASDGHLELCGPFADWPGGMLIIKAENKEQAIEIASKDPFVMGGVRDFEVRSWLLSCEENNHLGMG